MKNTTAILVFLQDESKDASNKRLTPKNNIGANQWVFSKLNSFVKQVSAATQLPVFYSNQLISKSSKPFGIQLSEAIQLVFEQGFAKVICIGNDCLALNKAKLLEAAEKLNNSETVLGPDRRGGVYLLGVSKDSFEPSTFENLAWQSGKMLQSYLNQYGNQQIEWLETLADIHTFEELKGYQHAKHLIAFLVQTIEQKYSSFQELSVFIFKLCTNSYHSLRAPPSI